MRVEAKFKGADGSMAYRTGRKYVLSLSVTSEVTIRDVTPDSKFQGTSCTYVSLRKFLDNWEVL